MPSIDGLRRRAQSQTHLESAYLRPRTVEPARSHRDNALERGAIDLSAELNEPATPAPAQAASAHPTSFGDLHPRRKKVTMIGVMLAMLLAALDQTIVSTALPHIMRDFGAADHLTWVVTAYMLASTVTVPIYGKLSDLFGRKWFFFSGIVIFLLGSVLAGASQNMTELIIFRALQGIGGGAIMGNAFAIIVDLFAPAERARWQGAMGGIFGLSSVLGPALGGWLTDNASWRWTFYVNLPIGLLALGFIAFLMPKVVPHVKDKVIDVWGGLTLVATLAPLLLALSFGGRQYAWDSTFILGSLGVSVIGLIAFIIAELRAKEPIMPLSLFKNPVFTVSMLIVFLSGAAMFGAIVYIPLFGQLVQGVSATNSGTILTPLMVGLIAASIISGQLIARTGKYKLLALFAAAELTGALLWLSTLSVDTTQLQLVLHMVALGLGIGILMPMFNVVVPSAFDRSRTGVVISAIQLFRSVGGTVGTAIFGSIMNNTLAARATDLSNLAFTKSMAAQGKDAADPNLLQGLLSSDGQAQVAAKLAQLPAAMQASAHQAFDAYLAAARADLTSAIAHVFLVASGTAAVAVVAAIFLKEIPLQMTHKPDKKRSRATEAGDELAAELGYAEPKDEPQLVR